MKNNRGRRNRRHKLPELSQPSDWVILIQPSEHGYRWRVERDILVVAEGCRPMLMASLRSAFHAIANEIRDECDTRDENELD